MVDEELAHSPVPEQERLGTERREGRHGVLATLDKVEAEDPVVLPLQGHRALEEDDDVKPQVGPEVVAHALVAALVKLELDRVHLRLVWNRVRVQDVYPLGSEGGQPGLREEGGGLEQVEGEDHLALHQVAGLCKSGERGAGREKPLDLGDADAGNLDVPDPATLPVERDRPAASLPGVSDEATAEDDVVKTSEETQIFKKKKKN